MSTLIYAGGVKATAITNIKAAINARIVTLADGTEDLNRESLIQWVRDQLNSMVGAGEATDATYIAGIDPTPIIHTLSDVIVPQHWATRPDWPAWAVSQSATSAQLLAGAQQLQGALKRTSEAVTALYANTQDLFTKAVQDYLDGNVISTIPAGIDLLEESRVYIATYVTDREEESAPSPVSDLITLDQNDTVSITVPAPPSGRNVTHFRIYRANSGNTGANLQYVPHPTDDDGWPIGTLTITDSVPAAGLQEPCPSLLWDEPPADLQGLVGGANGGMAGFRGNEFCPCVPYIPYAFPANLRITTEWPIVGLAASGQSYFVGTRGRPSIITGADTTTLSQIKLDEEQACASRKSIVAMGGGFIYASPDGLCLASASGVKLLTGLQGFNLWDRAGWQALNPASIVAAESERCYVFRWDNGTTSGMFSLDLEDGRLVTLQNTGSALYRDAVTDRLYLANGVQILALMGGNTARTAHWKSKRIVLPSDVSHSWAQVDSEFEAPVTVKTYLEGALIDTSTFTSLEPQRLPDGVGREWEVEVVSAARVTKVVLAENTEELNSL